MTNPNHDIVRNFFAAMSKGDVSDDICTPDMTAWTTLGGATTKEKFQGGVKALQSLFPNGLTYTADAIIAEGDRAAAEAQSRGTLVNGEEFHQSYAFTFRLRDGKIASVCEHNNPDVVREKIMPLFQAAMAKAQG